MTVFKIVLVIALAASVIIGCSEKDDPAADDEFQARLSGQWTLNGGSVKLNDADVTGAFPEIKITFNRDKSYSVIGPMDPIWPAAGTFTVEGNDQGLYNLLRDDGTVIEIDELTEHVLKFHQHYEVPQSRRRSVEGDYYFLMTR